MSWFELERLVEDAEKEPQLARALRHCRSNPELVLAARRLADQKEHKQQNMAKRLSN
ncbi:hypothetical protein [Synechococcus sp. UW140]|jgi:hypothetical protein|uniref:hypothetical protein n=1 Tax=unclassified Synechococcus TaxID=2626047 RepID=UPI003137A15E